MPEPRVKIDRVSRAKVFELYVKGLQQKEICKQLELSDRLVALYFIDFTATYHQTQVSKQVQLKILEDRLWQELETNPHSSLCYQLQWQYSNYLLNESV